MRRFSGKPIRKSSAELRRDFRETHAATLAVILRPLSYREPGQLVIIHEILPGIGPGLEPVDGAHFRERTRRAGGKHLNSQVAQHSGFGRTSHDTTTGGVRGEAVQGAILRAAPNNADLSNPLAG